MKSKEETRNWEVYVKKLIGEISKNENAVIVGITGSYKNNLQRYEKWGFKRKAENWKLRVYMNGGYILGIPLEERKFEFMSDEYFKEKYLSEDEKKQIEQIVNEVSTDKYAWEKGNFKLLTEYLNFMEKATENKFKNSKGMSVTKERMYQIRLFKKLMETPSDEYALMDVEYQSIAEMNYTEEKLIEITKKRESLHKGKPDYVAICKDGFLLIELKTNREALVGKAGVEEHSKDLKNLIEINKKNLYLANELKQRLRVMYEMDLLNASCREMAETILNTDADKLSIKDAYMFIIDNKKLTEKECTDFLDKCEINKNDGKVILKTENYYAVLY